MQFNGRELLWTSVMMLLFAVATVLAASTESRDASQFSMFHAMNETMIEERGAEHKLRKNTDCEPPVTEEDETCHAVCTPYKGECTKTEGEKHACMCTDEQYFEKECQTKENCHVDLGEMLETGEQHGSTCSCENKRCHCQWEASDGNIIPLTLVQETRVGLILCKKKVYPHACPNGMVGYCLPPSELFGETMAHEYWCLMPGDHGGFITLTEANEAYMSTPIEMDVVTKALEEHKPCLAICHSKDNGHPGYLVIGGKKPVCNCVAPPVDGKFSEVESVPFPCKPEDKKSCKVACGNKPGRCVPEKGACAAHCECGHPEKDEAKESH